MSLAKYDKYKDSGVEWLGEIPKHWEVNNLKRLCFLIKDGTHGSFNRVDFGFPLLSVRNIVNSKFVLLEDDSQITKDDYLSITKSFKIKENDIQLAIVGATMGKVALVPKLPPFATQRSLSTIRTKNRLLEFKYLFYYIQSSKIQGFLWANTSYSAQPGIYLGAIQEIATPLATLPEQTAIATYLDSKTSAIDRKVGLLEQKITRYQQLRKSLINETVCRGLDKKVKLKDSEIECLPADQAGIGMIPEHWEVSRIKDVCGFINRGSSPNYDENGSYKVVNQATFSKGFWDESSLRFTQNLEVKPRGLLKEDDILIASTGGGVLGKVYFFDRKESDYIADSHITILRDTRESYFSKYVYYYFSEKFKLINDILAQGSTNQTELQKDWLLAFSICIPPKQEQVAIANYLDEKTQKIDSIVSNIKSQVETLKELRKTLINDVVTGKIKVTEQ